MICASHRAMLSPSVSGSVREEHCLSYNKGHVCCHTTGTHALYFIYFPLDFNIGRRQRSTGGKANWNEFSQCFSAACFSGQNSQDKTNPFISTMLAFLGVSISFLFEARSWINRASSLFVGEVCDKPAVCCLHGGCVCTPEVKTSGGLRAGKLLVGVCPCCLLTSLHCAPKMPPWHFNGYISPDSLFGWRCLKEKVWEIGARRRERGLTVCLRK